MYSVSIYGSFFDYSSSKNSQKRFKEIKKFLSLVFAPLLGRARQRTGFRFEKFSGSGRPASCRALLLATVEELKKCRINLKNSKAIMKIKVLVEIKIEDHQKFAPRLTCLSNFFR